jgi:subtilisin family serine protease
MAAGRISTVRALLFALLLPVALLQPVHGQAAVVPEHPAAFAAAPQVAADTGTEDFARLPAPKAERPTPEPSSNAVLVRWRPGASAGARARDLKAAGGRVTAQLPNGWTAVTGKAAAALRDRLARAPSVARVEPDFRRRAAGEDVLYAKAQRSVLDAVRWPEARNLAGTPSADLVVAVVDTGVAANHPDLAGRVLPGYDATGAGTGGADDNGHGTAVAGIVAAKTGNDEGIAGVASGVSILPVKVLDADGYGYDSDVAEGVRWAADHDADVINMSLSGLGSTTVLSDAVAYARSRGVVLVAAVGNFIGGALTYPASYPNVLSVGATDGSGDVVRDAGPYGRDRYHGSGLLDMAAALGAAARPVSGPAVRDSFEPDDTPARAHPPGTGQRTHDRRRVADPDG